MIDVTELQRQRIKQLEDYISQQTKEHCALVDAHYTLVTAITYLTGDDKFKEFVARDWNRVMSYYCENNDNA